MFFFAACLCLIFDFGVFWWYALEPVWPSTFLAFIALL